MLFITKVRLFHGLRIVLGHSLFLTTNPFCCVVSIVNSSGFGSCHKYRQKLVSLLHLSTNSKLRRAQHSLRPEPLEKPIDEVASEIGQTPPEMHGSINWEEEDTLKQVPFFRKRTNRKLAVTAYLSHADPKVCLHGSWKDVELNGLNRTNIKEISGIYAFHLRRCGNSKSLCEGKRVHAHIRESGHAGDRYLGNLLVQMYGNCGALEDARVVFAGMHDRNVFSWGIMIGAYVQDGHGHMALHLFQQMLLETIIPDKVTFISLLSACASQVALPNGKRMHVSMVDSDIESDIVIGTALINMYGKCGSLGDAQKMFDNMPECNLVSWNAILAAYAQNEQGKETLKVFQQMQVEGIVPNNVTFVIVLDACASLTALAEGKQRHASIISNKFESDIIIGNALVNVYGKCGNLYEARKMFDEMMRHNVVSWNALIAAYGQHGRGKEVLQLFEEMQQEGVIPDKITFFSVLSACSHAALYKEGWHYFDAMNRDYGVSPALEHFNCMIDLLGRAGLLDDGEELISGMPFSPNVKSWMALLSACKMHLDVERGKRVAEHLFFLDPENPTPYVLLSNICTAAGSWKDAAQVRKRMKEKGLKKKPDCRWMKVKNRVHEFFEGDKEHPQNEVFCAELERLSKLMKEAGYMSDTEVVLHDLDKEEEVISCH